MRSDNDKSSISVDENFIKKNLEEVTRDIRGPNIYLLAYTYNGVEVVSYDAQDRLTRYKDNAYTYNVLGQLSNKTSPRGSANYHYDVQGNLLGVETELGNRIEYLIDPLNRRVGRKVNGTITNKYLYLGQLHPIAELYPDTDQLKYLFIYAEKAHVPSAIEHYNESNQLIATYRVLTNHLGSVVKVVNTEDHSIVQAIEYDAWGNVLSDTNPLFQPFYYAGGLYDPETKLTRFGARDYDAEIGRWTAKDPIGFAGGLTSLYDYVGGDPINFIDPSGEILFHATVHWTRNYWNKAPLTVNEAEKKGWRLLPSDKSIYHQMGAGNENNRKFVSPNGHHEAVFDCDGNLVTDPANMGTFNYFGPEYMWGIPHGIFDVAPYYVLGNTPSDMFNPQRFPATYNALKDKIKQRWESWKNSN